MNPKKRILVLDDDILFRKEVDRIIGRDFELTPVKTIHEASDLIRSRQFDFFLLDRHLGSEESLSIVPLIRACQGNAGIIIMTSDMSDDVVKKYIDAGATDYLYKTENFQIELPSRLRVAIARHGLEKRIETAERIIESKIDSPLIGSSFGMNEVRAQIDTFSHHNNINVLITGESGTGKELIARAIHKSRRDQSRPFVIVNCGAIQKDLIGSELFGHKKGAFTGAISDKPGKIELANGGDLFLDEIGELPLETQASLLRCLNHGGFERLGATTGEETSHFRLISATNRNLDKMVEEGKFREDLLYRIRMMEISSPPLRERKEDIIEISEYILRTETGSRFYLSDDAVESLKSHKWPGNVRELKNTLICATAYAGKASRKEIRPQDLFPVKSVVTTSSSGTSKGTVLHTGNLQIRSDLDYEEALQSAEKIYLEARLAEHSWNVAITAESIGIGPQTLYKRMRALSIASRANTRPRQMGGAI